MTKYLHSGFTLIELLVVGAIFMLVSLIITQITISIIRTNVKVEKMRVVKQEGDFAIDRLHRYLADAYLDIGANCTQNGAENYSLSFTRIDAEGKSVSASLACEEDGDGQTTKMMLTEDGVGNELLGNSVTLISPTNQAIGCSDSQPKYTCYSTGSGAYDTPQKLTVEFSLAPRDVEHENIDSTMIMNFKTEIVLRNIQNQ